MKKEMRLKKNYSELLAVILLNIGLLGCVGDNIDSKLSSKLASAITVNKVSTVHSEEYRKFKEEDSKRSRKYLDTHPIHNEKSGDVAIKNLKDALSDIPSHLFERFNEHTGILEFNSEKFTKEDMTEGVISKIDPSHPNKIYLNTHIDQRNYSLEKLDSAKLNIIKLKFDLEWKKFAIIDSPAMSLEKKAILVGAYKDFILKVMADDKNPTNVGGVVARDFFFGTSSEFHGLSEGSQVTNELIEQNLQVVQYGLSKAITYHAEMDSSKGSTFLSSRFPETNKLITSLYFEIHVKDSPHLDDLAVPKALIDAMDKVTSSINVSSSAFETYYTTYVASKRRGKYIAADSLVSASATDRALDLLFSDTTNIKIKIDKLLEQGVGNCEIQAVVVAGLLKENLIDVFIYRLDGWDTHYNYRHYLVFATMPDGKIYSVDPWVGMILPAEQFQSYYSDFRNVRYDENLNNLFKSWK